MGKEKSKLLILTSNSQWATTAVAHLHKSFEAEVYGTGKEGQLVLYKKEFSFVYIDLSITNNSATEVIRYVRQKFPLIKIFVFCTQNTWIEGNWDETSLRKNGAHEILVDFLPEDINKPVMNLGMIKKWEDVQETQPLEKDETEKSIEDQKFTRIKIEELFHDTVAIFDYYIRLGSNRYVKIINQGEKPSEEQIRRYSSNGAQYLFFLSENRADFIGYQNDVIAKKIRNNSGETGKILKSMKSVTDKYLEEIYVSGLQPQLIEEGKSICENVYQFTQKDTGLKKMLSQLEEFNPTAYSHSFLVCFFTTLISKNLDWIGSKTRDALALGAMFHDIGLIHVPEEIANKHLNDMNQEEKIIFQKHPEKGKESVTNIPSITRTIMEIIAQHHEVSDGTGYPHGLTSSRIFPMAKVVGLADAFSGIIVEKEISPLDGLKEFLGSRENLTRYEPDLIKNLIKGFIPDKKI